MKKLLSIFTAAALAAGIVCFAEEPHDFEYGVSVTVNGDTVDFPDQEPVIAGGRTLIPVRGVFEKLGADVSYTEATDTVHISYKDIKITFPVGSREISVTEGGADRTEKLDTAAISLSGRTMVPLRFAAETIGADVSWDESLKTAVITTAPPHELYEIPAMTRVSAGRNHLAAVKDDGTVWLIKQENGGLFGSPVKIPALSSVTAVASGKDTVYALKGDGTVWRFNADESDTPEQIEGLSDITEISAGESHLLALGKGGTVFALGSNRRGQLGTGDTENRTAPVKVEGLSGVTAISAGSDHSSAVMDETLYTWGGNGFGQLGLKKGIGLITKPQSVKAITKIVDVKAGGTFTLAVRSDGSIYEFGTVYVGEKGDDDEKDIADSEGFFLIEEPSKVRYIYQEFEDSPYMSRVLTNVSSLTCGDMHAAALKDGRLYAWGGSALFKPRRKTQTLRLNAFPYGGTIRFGEDKKYLAAYAGKKGEIYLLSEDKQLLAVDPFKGRVPLISLSV